MSIKTYVQKREIAVKMEKWSIMPSCNNISGLRVCQILISLNLPIVRFLLIF